MDLVKLEELLNKFGTVYKLYIEDNKLVFIINDIEYLYAVSNFGDFIKNNVLGSFPYVYLLSMDKLRLKGIFLKEDIKIENVSITETLKKVEFNKDVEIIGEVLIAEDETPNLINTTENNEILIAEEV